MLAGSMTSAAYLVIGRTMSTIGASWSPSWRSGRPLRATVVSLRTWPDTYSAGTESCHWPSTPVTAFVPPGPLVTQTTPGSPVTRA